MGQKQEVASILKSCNLLCSGGISGKLTRHLAIYWSILEPIYPRIRDLPQLAVKPRSVRSASIIPVYRPYYRRQSNEFFVTKNNRIEFTAPDLIVSTFVITQDVGIGSSRMKQY